MNSDPEISKLIDLLLEDELDLSGRGRLNELLRENPDGIEQVTELLLNESSLSLTLKEDESAERFKDQLPLTQMAAGEQGSLRKKWLIFATAAAIAILIGLAPFLIPTPEPPPHAPEAVAKLLRTFDAQFVDDAAPKNSFFPKGTYELCSGSAQLEMNNGTLVMVDSPCSFTIESELKIILHQGRMRARVPTGIDGFTIKTPDIDITDLGTEFGVNVMADKNSEVHVFSGEVQLSDHRIPVTRILKEGTTETWKQGLKTATTKLPDEHAFRSPQERAFDAWKEWQKDFLKDPDLIALYDFRPDSKNSKTLINRANPGQYDGRVYGPTWVSGRWPDKGGMLFEKPGDRVGIHIPDEFHEFSLSTWIKVNHFESPVTAILNANRLKPNEVQLQIRDNGGIRVSAHKRAYGNTNLPVVVPGQWTHIAVTYDGNSGDSGKLRIFANGIPVKKMSNFEKGPAFFNHFQLGHWAYPSYWPHHRDFRGRMDEVLILKRSLKDDEVKDLYEVGKPARW